MKRLAIMAAFGAALALSASPAQATCYGYCPAPTPPSVGGGGSSAAPALGIIACSAGIVFTAMYVNWKYNAPLDGPGFCGLGAKPAVTKVGVVKAKG